MLKQTEEGVYLIDRNGRHYDDQTLQESRQRGALKNSNSKARALEFLEGGAASSAELQVVTSRSVMTKLKKEGLIAKTNGRYQLTPEGADWLVNQKEA